MLKEAEVREVISRLERGEKVTVIVRELGVDERSLSTGDDPGS